jgi:osmotically-inducible protein OsmY
VKTTIYDEILQAAVTAELDWDSKVDATHIGVSAKDGAVTLTGYVPSETDKVAAVRAAERVEGVNAVADDVAVQLRLPGKVTDAEIAEQIARRRGWNPEIPATIEAEVADGRVTLCGEVEWSYQRELAEDAWELSSVFAPSPTKSASVRGGSSAMSDEREGSTSMITAAGVHGRHLLNLAHFSPDEITYLIDLAAELKAAKQERREEQKLVGKEIALIFEKDSTRTRCAFEVAAYDQGAHVTFIGPSGSHMGHKETVKDTARVLGRMYDAIEYRGFAQEMAEELARWSGVPV